MTVQINKDQKGNFYIKQVYFFGLFSDSGYLDVDNIIKPHPRLCKRKPIISTWASYDNILGYCQIKTEGELKEIISSLKRIIQDRNNERLKFTKVRQIKIS